ncbi:MFS transporter [Solirubrobacter ginsenosidimutans]|uniref:MFS transporter n=1 Tax=Solirubrobacter ginsenosidimutans TaxID=490573 RepID=A0A9X3MWA5_9ACTN|nr:MFS transporter [Solirubrobacter ginsenosidimutans]MDA0163602.1 MFS transporter [Solirubrobacter ginsenosidimutans]
MSRDTRIFLCGQSLSLLGDTALWLALGLWVKDLTGSSSAAGLVFLCIVAPQLASPFAGLLVDRVRRRTLLLAVNPLTALAVLPLLAVHDRGDVWIIYAVAVAYGASYVVLSAGQSALLHTLVPTEQLAKANATLQTVREALRLITPLAGAGLYTLAGGAAVALLDSATFLAATAALFALKLREPKPQPHANPGITAGARHIARTPDLKAMVAGCALCMLVIGFSETLIFELPDALGKPSAFVGVLMAVQGVGAIVGALTATTALKRHGEVRAAGFGMTIFALGALLMADSDLPVVLAGKVLFGLGLPWIVVALLTLLQRSTPANLQGRAFAASELALGAPQTLSIALGAALVALVDYRVVLLVQAATVGLAGVALLNRMHGPWRLWTGTSTTSSSHPTGSPARTPARWWKRWRRSVPRP